MATWSALPNADLNSKGWCKGYNISYLLLFIYSEKNIWISEIDSVHWHPKCYSTFFNPKDLSFMTSQELGPLYDPQKPSPLLVQSRATRASNPQFCIKEVCMFCSFKKHYGNTRLIAEQHQSVTGKLKKTM